MTSCRLLVSPEKWPLKEPFHISRGVKTVAEVVRVELEQGEFRGQGESAPYARYGEGIDSVINQIEAVRGILEKGLAPGEVQDILPAGAARNAVDCALWDLKARRENTSVANILNLPLPKNIDTAVTIGIGSAEDMAGKALKYKDFPLLKIKLNQEEIKEKVRAIRAQAPKPRIIIDPNESWTVEILQDLDDFLSEMRIDLLEQPLKAGEDDGLLHFKGKIPLCADESCHTRKDLEGLRGKYQVINIKLDKTGGLTEAVALKNQALGMGFDIMIGCMVSTSLAMAPALLLASDAPFVDLDGPLWMKQDRDHGLSIEQGCIAGSSPLLWGGLQNNSDNIEALL